MSVSSTLCVIIGVTVVEADLERFNNVVSFSVYSVVRKVDVSVADDISLSGVAEGWLEVSVGKGKLDRTKKETTKIHTNYFHSKMLIFHRLSHGKYWQTLLAMQDHFYNLQPDYGILFQGKFQPFKSKASFIF